MSRDRTASIWQHEGECHVSGSDGVTAHAHHDTSLLRSRLTSLLQRERQPRTPLTMAAALAELAVTLSHSPLSSQPFGTIHEPPMQTTFGCDR